MDHDKTRAPRPMRAPPAKIPATMLLRVVLLASVGVAASIYGLVRYYTHPHMPEWVPAPAQASSNAAGDAGAGLVEIEIETR